MATKQEDLLSFARAALPAWFTSDERIQEELHAFAEQHAVAWEVIEYWLRQTRILLADGPVGSLPDWLGQLAIDRGTRRQDGEDDDVLRERLRNREELITRVSLLAAAQAIVDADPDFGTGTVAMLELRRDRAFFVDLVADTGTGGVFTGPVDDVMTFTPDAGFDGHRPPFRAIEPAVEHRIELAGGAIGDNEGDFVITGISGNGASFTNAIGVADVDPTMGWTVTRYRGGNLRTGFAHSYLSRGYRMGSQRSTFIMILPFGTTAGTEAGIREMLRIKKGAGIKAILERRTSP